MSRILAIALAAVTVASTAVPLAAAAPAQDQRQRAFRAAAAEFDVPERVLLGVSYLESRWDANGGSPSTAAGYGPMHLTDVVTADSGGSHHDEGSEDPRGDTSRPTLRPEPGEPDLSSPSLRTIEAAAKLSGVDAGTLRSNPSANIRGGAALLAQYQREIGKASDNPADWYGAVARYSGSTTEGAAKAFANEVYSVLRTGVERTTDDGNRVSLKPSPGLRPETSSLSRLNLTPSSATAAECPSDISCEWLPAPYQQLPNGGYGNHDKANRPNSQTVDYIVIHDTEATWNDTIRLVRDPAYVSWHYSLRSSDGHIAQHVSTNDIGWHAGNWYVNSKSIGLEHEGFAAQGTWYTEAMYRTSAKLVKYLAAAYKIPLDRAHIIGHDNVPGVTPDKVKGMHWDPGPYWDWARYFSLMGAPLAASGSQYTDVVMIKPDFANNKPAFTGCDANAPSAPCPLRGSTSVVLRSEPRDDAPLLFDAGLRPDGSRSTMLISDHGSRVETGQKFVVAGRSGDWLAVWYLGQKGWLRAANTVTANGKIIIPKNGLASVPVYGRAYPQASAYPPGIPVEQLAPLQYTFAAGQGYTFGLSAPSEYYWADGFDASKHVVVRGEQYHEIQFGHRVFYVKASDVVVTGRR